MEANRALAADQAQNQLLAEEPEVPAARPRLKVIDGLRDTVDVRSEVAALEVSPPDGASETAQRASRLAVSRSVEAVLTERRGDISARSGNFLERVKETMRRQGISNSR